jgi:hypothetical protein
MRKLLLATALCAVTSTRRWDILDAAGNWRGPENVDWWYEVPEAADGVVIVP